MRRYEMICVGAGPAGLAAAVEAAKPFGIPVTVKMRIGIDTDHHTYLEAAKSASDSGVAWVALHARTAEQMYEGKADWSAISRLVEHLKPTGVPVLGNGDIWSGADAVSMVEQSGCAGVVVGRGVDDLGKVDDHWPVTGEQDIELGEVAVNESGAQHEHDLVDQQMMVRAGQRFRQAQIVETRGDSAVTINDQLHDQDPFRKAIGCGYTDPGVGQITQGITLGVLPDLLLFLAPEPRVFSHGAGAATATDLATFRVLCLLMKTAMLDIFVNFGASGFATTAHQEHL